MVTNMPPVVKVPPAADAPLVMVVEDEAKIARILLAYLADAGLRSVHAADGGQAMERFAEGGIACILLDLNLPVLDGIEVCKRIRAVSQVPIAMLTARVDEIDRLIGLEIGADDYICKPASPREVVARVKALLRRAALRPAKAPEREPERAGFELDEERLQLRIDGKVVPLTALEFRLFATLAARPGRVLSRNQLLDALHGNSRELVDRTVDSHVRNLRKKLTEVNRAEVIRSVYGVGYAIEPCATEN
jgi:two-component system, OmpR family, response regulator BaeR